MTKTKKSQIIGNILKITKAEPTKYFDSLNDKSDQYLGKLLTVCKNINAV